MSQLSGFNEVDISALSENVVIEEFPDFGAVVEIGNDLVQDADESTEVDVRGAAMDFHIQPTELSGSNGYTVADDGTNCIESEGPSVSSENVPFDGDSSNIVFLAEEETDFKQDQAETNSSGNVNCSFEIERNSSNVVKEEFPSTSFRLMDSPSDAASHSTDVNCMAGMNALIKKEEDIEAEEGGEVSVSHDSDILPEQRNDIYDEVSVAKCDEVKDYEMELNSQDDSVSFFEPVKLTNDESRPDGAQLSEVYYDRAHIRLVEVSVVLEDLFPKNKAGNTQRFTVEGFRVKPNCLKGVENLRVQQKMKDSEESTMKEWYSCTECPARFKFGHSLELHTTRSHHIYFCTECDVSYKLQSDLRVHFTTHRSRKFYSCLCCGFKSKTELDLRIHAKSHRREKLFSCGECFAEFEESRLLLTHILGHSNEKRFECAHCSVKFRTKSGIKAHVLDHLGRKPYSCTLCSAKFKRRKQLKEHVTRHSKEKPHLCTHCPATFRFIRELKTHLATHVKKTLFYSKIFSCSICAAKFKFSSDLKEHTATHHPVTKRLSSEERGAVFKTKTAVKRHKASRVGPSQSKETSEVKNRSSKKKTKPSERPFSCPHCSAAYMKKSHLTKHLSLHSEDRPFSCPDCDSTFKTKENLKLHHLVVHTNERQFACTYCQSHFKTKKGLRQHTLTHFNVKPFACSDCSATFKYKKVLTLHMLTHTNAKPHKCSVCSAAFKFKGSLQRHMASHADEKVFACPLCPAKLKQERYLRDHIRMHENNTLRRTISCPHCPGSFKTKAFFKRHMAKHTDGKFNFACPHCPLNFKQNRFLLTHLETHANETIKENLLCPQCPTVCENQETLEQHLSTHQNEPQETESSTTLETQPKIEESLAAHSGKLIEKGSNEESIFVECPVKFETESTREELSAVDLDRLMERDLDKETEQPRFVVARLKTDAVAATGDNNDIDETFSFVDCTSRIKAEPVDDETAYQNERMETNNEEFSFVDCSGRVKTESIPEQLFTDGSVKLMEMDGNEEAEVFSCEQCLVAFQTRQNLEKHLATHSNERVELLSQTAQCPTRTKTRSILPKHPVASNQIKHAKDSNIRVEMRSESTQCPRRRKTRPILPKHPVVNKFFCSSSSVELKDCESSERHLKNCRTTAPARTVKVEFVRTLRKII